MPEPRPADHVRKASLLRASVRGDAQGDRAGARTGLLHRRGRKHGNLVLETLAEPPGTCRTEVAARESDPARLGCVADQPGKVLEHPAQPSLSQDGQWPPQPLEPGAPE